MIFIKFRMLEVLFKFLKYFPINKQNQLLLKVRKNPDRIKQRYDIKNVSDKKEVSSLVKRKITVI